MLVADKNSKFEIDTKIELDYDQWDKITLKNLLNAYEMQLSEFYSYLEKVGNSRYDEDWLESMLEEANDMMDHLERVIQYYSTPDANYCDQIRDNYAAKRRIGKMGWYTNG